jgi:hypothetical protein
MKLKSPELDWFWSIIPDDPNGNTDNISANYMEALELLTDVDLAKFATHCGHIINITQNNDKFHDLCRLIGVNSDDERYDLATWLIIKGRTFWNTALNSTDDLAEYKNFDFLSSTYGFEELEAFEEMEFDRDIDLFDMQEEHGLLYNYPAVIENLYPGKNKSSMNELAQSLPKLSKILSK